MIDWGKGEPIHAPLAYHWARMIEVLHCMEVIKELLDDPDILSGELMTSGARQRSGVGVIEAPRGTLIHHYEVGDNDLVTMCNLIVSTTHNNQAMNEAVRSVAREYLDGHEITEGLLNHIEVAIRAYDPCLSCATHALGQMPLDVALVGCARRHARPRAALVAGRNTARGFDMSAGVLIFGWGNLSRGDDALGPLCIERLRDAFGASPELEFLDDYQLQVEHALDLVGRERILFIDASVEAAAPFEVTRVTASPQRGISTHVLSPQGLLQVYRDLHGEDAPACTLLAIRGRDFELGAAPSVEALAHLDAAVAWARGWLGTSPESVNAPHRDLPAPSLAGSPTLRG